MSYIAGVALYTSSSSTLLLSFSWVPVEISKSVEWEILTVLQPLYTSLLLAAIPCKLIFDKLLPFLTYSALSIPFRMSSSLSSPAWLAKALWRRVWKNA